MNLFTAIDYLQIRFLKFQVHKVSLFRFMVEINKCKINIPAPADLYKTSLYHGMIWKLPQQGKS